MHNLKDVKVDEPPVAFLQFRPCIRDLPREDYCFRQNIDERPTQNLKSAHALANEGVKQYSTFHKIKSPHKLTNAGCISFPLLKVMFLDHLQVHPIQH
jgi:hypothetical protein